MMRGFWMLFVFYKFWVVRSEELASFFGNSYISVPLQEAYATNDIEFSFRTWLPDAMFLLVAGKTDFCIIQLESGILKLRINLGAGEEEISSPHDIKFNDGDWHKVKVVRKEANLTLDIDRTYVVRKHLPGLFFELNIQFGIFIGGDGHFKEQFLGHLVGLRGCMSDLIYADINLLEFARRRKGSSKVHGITWNCASEFDSTVNTGINYVEDNAYVLLLHSVGRAGARWQFDLKTTSNDSVLLYNSGPAQNAHTVAIEIITGRLSMLFNNIKSHKVFNNVFVADNKWHKIIAQFNPYLLELTVDTTVATSKIIGTKYLELSDTYYIGGLELSKRTRAMVKGVSTAELTYLGCLKGLAVNGEPIGLSSAKSTFGIKANTCLTDKSLNKSAVELEIVSTKPVIVSEGKTGQIAQNHIRLIIDYPRWGLRDNMIHFRIVSLKYGKIYVNGGTNNKFTLTELYNGRVEYVHDGSETLRDTLAVELKINDVPLLPQYLRETFMFSVTINIEPQNDPPVVIAPGLLQMAKGTRKIITNDILNVTDVDSDPSKIAYYLVKTMKYSKSGQIEFIDQPNKAITSFTQKDIDDKKVVFACIECTTLKNVQNNVSEIIILNVTDGKSAFQTLVLKILLVDLELMLKNTKGVFVVHNSTALIQSKDLSFSSNVIDDFLLNNVRIDVVEQPQFGILECKRDDKYWNICDWFYTGDVVQKRVRYKHVSGSPEFDEFKFRAAVNKIHTPTLYNFKVTFIKLKLEQLHLNPLILNGTLHSVIEIDNIEYQTIPILASNKNIKFIITELPRYGDIVLINSHQIKLQNGDSFTQQDIEKEYLNYILRYETYSRLNDTLKFIVSSKNCENVNGHFDINYLPAENLQKQIQVKIVTLQVIEGEKSNIGIQNIDIRIQSNSKLIYNITSGLYYGRVQKCFNKICNDEKYCSAHHTSEFICRNISQFRTDDIVDGLIYYHHDDTETRHDFFTFMALTVPNNLLYIGNFTIDIILKNDNRPVRVVDRILQVVFEQTKLITDKDLKYTDADINTTPKDIIYTCEIITNGALFNVRKPGEKITTFTQADLNNRVVLFKHHGDEYGKISLWITDGQFYENGVLEIFASKPFIKILTNEIIVKINTSVIIDEQYVDIETNLNVPGKSIIYRILKAPKYGYLKFILNNDNVRFFNHDDITAGHIVYVHNKSNFATKDQFSIRATYDNTYAEAKIYLKILPAVYWQPLIILSTNESLAVEESTSITIPKTHLEILHPEISPDEIIYYIKIKPKYGYIQHKLRNPQESIDSFSQNNINLGELQYIQNVANKTHDHIVFDVTNGIIWLHNVTLNIYIIPEHFYIRTKQLNVIEGGSVTIFKEHLQVITEYYVDKIVQYSISRMPKHGSVQIGTSHEHIQKFSERDLTKNLVKYVHDNSENFEDFFEIVSHSKINNKESEPAIIHVKISPINDQVPMLVNNTGLQMWEGGCERISSINLGALDGDIPPDTITYRITGNWWGNLVLKTNATPLQSFTQKQLEDGLIYFNHTNGTIAKFMFRLTDNVHTSKEHTFTIETKPVKLSLITNTGLHVFPFNRQLITTKNLLAKASDPTRDIIYRLIVLPTLGRIAIAMDNENLYSTDKFSQKDLDNRKIFYEHTHPFDGLYANDSFVFNLEGRLLPSIMQQKFEIDISVSSGDLNTYIPITPIVVNEGGTAPILLNISQVVQFLENNVNIHAPIIHASLWPPEHGSVYVNDSSNVTTFTQAQLESNVVKYQHDHSDTLNDTVRFTLYLLPDYITLCTVNIPVRINPINDQPFKLITQAPHMKVVYGENATITKDVLLTEDPDTPPHELEYVIINEPKDGTEGNIFLEPDPFPINKFTQKDINDGRVLYKHSGSNTTVSFHFRVWDGYFKPQYTIFNIEVIPINIYLTALSPVYVQQGLKSATISTQHIQVRTNVNINKIMYNITKLPLYGMIYVQDAPKSSFTHNDLINEHHVMYIQTNMTSANDTFEIVASVPTIAVSNTISLIMLVQPLMQRGNFTAIIGKQNRIGLNVLDATPLAELTASTPVYKIVRKPTFGSLHKIIRNSGDRKIVYDQEVTSFTHEEIRSGVIYYVLPLDETLNEIGDLLKFMLIGNIFFPPAYGELKIRISSDRIEPELKRHRGGMHLASPNMSSDYFPIVIMVIGVLLLGISVIIIIKCRSIDMIKEEPTVHNSHQQPIPLPRPPDHLMSSTSNLKPPHIEEIPLTSHISLPHCKVTPLGPTESSLASSDLDIRSRYPYGSAEDGTIIEDWCSHDAPSDNNSQQPPVLNVANPLLRRNQYWV